MENVSPDSMILAIWQQFEVGFSTDRLAGYVRSKDTDKADAIGRYLWNAALCETLYLPLQTLEITFRNALHNSLTKVNGRDDWYRIANLLDDNEDGKVQDAIIEIGKRPGLTTPRKVVAELTFGFWTSLINSQYDQSIVVPTIKTAFPKFDSSNQNRIFLSRRFERIRHLRNRVFHHEPIWHWGDLIEQHKQVYETIGWMNPTVAGTTRRFDRFKSIFNAGPGEYADSVRAGASAMANRALELAQQRLVQQPEPDWNGTKGD